MVSRVCPIPCPIPERSPARSRSDPLIGLPPVIAAFGVSCSNTLGYPSVYRFDIRFDYPLDPTPLVIVGSIGRINFKTIVTFIFKITSRTTLE